VWLSLVDDRRDGVCAFPFVRSGDEPELAIIVRRGNTDSRKEILLRKDDAGNLVCLGLVECLVMSRKLVL